MKTENIRDAMETAHDKEMQMIDVKADEVKDTAEDMHQAKMRAFDKVVAAIRARRGAMAAKTSDLSETVTQAATGLGETVTQAATDLTETVGMKASELGEKAGEIKVKTTRRMQAQPWIAPMAAVVLLLAVVLSVSKKMRAPAIAS